MRTQVIERLDTVRVSWQGVPIEVALTQDMHHLGVARCLAWGIGQADPQLAKLSPAAATPTCWMVQEYCDKHTLVVGGMWLGRHQQTSRPHVNDMACIQAGIARHDCALRMCCAGCLGCVGLASVLVWIVHVPGIVSEAMCCMDHP